MPGVNAALALGLPDPAVTDAGGRRWADLRTRTLSAAVLAPVVLACIWFGGWLWFVLAAFAMAGMMTEWAAMCGTRASKLASAALLFGGIAGVGSVLEGARGQGLVFLLAGGVLTAAVSRRAVLGLAALYIGVPMLCLAAMRGPDAVGRANVLFVVAIVWASDIGAYLTGRLVGGPKLAPAISPGKTRSGAVGGLVAAMLAGEAVVMALGGGLSVHAAVAAVVLGVASQAGDLLESWIKRHFGVKDSGWLIPGHGGLLDRLDGMLAAAVAATLLMNTGMFGRGGVLWN